MSHKKLYGRDLKEYEDIDIDELLAKLTPEEIEELGQELIDPDDSCIPPAQRCRYKTDKEPTGDYSRKDLLKHLEKTAKEDKDWEEQKPYTKETRGKVWKPKEEEKIQIHEDEDVATEWDEVLANATEEELVDLAAILGFHGMLNQVQYHQAFVVGEKEEEKDEEGKPKGGGFQGIAKHQNFKLVKDNPANETNVEEALQKLKDNDPKMKELNLNNIKNISLERLCEFAKALETNTHLETLGMSNTRATDTVAKAIAKSLRKNKTLKTINLESNYISGEGIVALLESINKYQKVTELRMANQRPQILGHKIERRIAELMSENKTMLRFGIFLQVPDARIKVMECQQKNYDSFRRQRQGEAPEKIPEPKESESEEESESEAEEE